MAERIFRGATVAVAGVAVGGLLVVTLATGMGRGDGTGLRSSGAAGSRGTAGSSGAAGSTDTALASTSESPRANQFQGTVVSGVAAAEGGIGYWVADADGAVTTAGPAVSHGDAADLDLGTPIVGIAPTPAGGGYWLVASGGGVFGYGDAGFYGSAASYHPAQPAVAMAGDPAGTGYWVLTRNGGIFSFGSAGFAGAPASYHPTQPATAMTPDPAGSGYWVVTRDGGVFSFGAAFAGSASQYRPSAAIVGVAATKSGNGYWLVERNGGVFSFGDAHFYGSAGRSRLPAPVIGIISTSDGGGYWIVLDNGTVRAFGDARTVDADPVSTTGWSLAGEIVGIDPGHNGDNYQDPSYIDQQVWNGREYEDCDTTGTSTDAGYTEAAFNFDVATRLSSLLRSEGATVVMTRDSNSGVGPCVTTRAAIINDGPSDVGIDIHADGGPPGGRGVAVLEPVADGPNNSVIDSSDQLARMVLDEFQSATGEPDSSYDGTDGLQPRDDLAGLNLTTVAKVLIECANMRNATDASLVTSASWRQDAAQGMTDALTEFLVGYA